MGLNIKSSTKINGVYEIHEIVGNGNFAEIYRVTDPNGTQYAAKFVSESSFCFLENETTVMPFAGGRQPGMPCWYHLGRHGKHFVLVMDLFGHSLRSIRNKHRSVSLHTLLLLCTQMPTSIEFVHKRGFMHRDTTPDNFVLGKYGEDRKCLYLIDYGFAERHTPQSVLSSGLYSTKRDLHSVVSSFVYFWSSLPWERISFASRTGQSRLRDFAEMAEIWADIPGCIQNYYMDVLNLGEDKRPDYDRLRGHLQGGLSIPGLEANYEFEWMRRR